MKRFGQIIGVKPEHFEEYKKFHAAVWPEVLKKIKDCNVQNYSIFHKYGLLFAYMEYTSDDFDTPGIINHRVVSCSFKAS